MSEELIPLTEKEKRIGSVAAYDIHLKRQVNEDRILAERTSMFLLATSFLFLAFVTLLTSDLTGCIFTTLRILLPLVGISLTLLLLFFNIRAVKALGRWHDAQCKIEEAAETEVFKYMLAKEISPHYGRIMRNEEEEEKKRKEEKKKKEKVKKPKGWLGKTILKAKSILLRLKAKSKLPSKLSSTRAIYWLYLPITFFVLWIAALAVAIVIVAS